MSDESDDSSVVIKVVKLTTGEEIVGILINDSGKEYEISFPARVDVHYGKGPDGMTEFVKLSNYAASVLNYTLKIPHTATVFVGEPNQDLRIMYMTYCEYMRNDPKMIISSAGEDSSMQKDYQGLEMLNELFSNSDFVEFVNELIDNYEGTSVEEEEEEEETFIIEEPEEKEIQPKKKKKVKPESKKLPYNPDANPNTAEGWSDNPNDYIG